MTPQANPSSAAALWAKGLLVARALALTLCAARAAAGETSVPWELQPYDIQLLVHVEAGALPPDVAERLGAQLVERARVVVGGAWRMTDALAPAELGAAMSADLEGIAAEDLPATAREHDKVLLLVVAPAGHRTALAVRELDVRTGLWNSTLRRSASTHASIAHAAFELLLAGFAPLGRVEKLDGDTATVRLRGGSIPRRDPALPLLAAGAALRPVLLASEPREVSAVPWTWLAPTRSEGPLVECRVLSALDGPPLPEFHPQRERLVLAATPVAQPFRLRLVAADAEALPQAGVDVYRQGRAGTADRWLARSDRDGWVVIAPGEAALETLLVCHGRLPLARLPLLPGVERAATVGVSATPARLAAEQFLLAARDSLIDTIARRALLMGRIRSHIDRDQITDARKLLKELGALPRAESLAAQISIQQRALWPDGKPADDPLARQFAELQAQVDERLSKKAIDELESELSP